MAAWRSTNPYPTSQKPAVFDPSVVSTGRAVACSACCTSATFSLGFACSSTAAAPAACGDAMLVPDAVSLESGGHGPTATPIVSHVDEMSTPGVVMSGWYTPMREPVNVHCATPLFGMASAVVELSNSAPFDEKSPRAGFAATVDAATDSTHGASENGLRLSSASSEPELPAANTTTTLRSATYLVATLTGSFLSNGRYEFPHELLTTSTPHSGWSIMWS